MKQTRLVMGMPVTVDIVDSSVTKQTFDEVFDYFSHIDRVFSTYKPRSEISRINNGSIKPNQASQEMQIVLHLCEQTKQRTGGYFDIKRNGYIDPSGLVKGWAVQNAAQLLRDKGLKHFYVDAGGDIQVSGYNSQGKSWHVGIRNPFNREEVVKTLAATTQGVATSGTAIRGQHVYNPHQPARTIDDIVSITVIGPDIYNADRFATAAFAMGEQGIGFIEQLPNHEAYMVNANGTATFTTNFERYTV